MYTIHSTILQNAPNISNDVHTSSFLPSVAVPGIYHHDEGEDINQILGVLVEQVGSEVKVLQVKRNISVCLDKTHTFNMTKTCLMTSHKLLLRVKTGYTLHGSDDISCRAQGPLSL